MASELKPCPFCGATAKLNKYYGGTAFTVVCDNLHRINTFEKEAEAVATWNTRPIPVAPVSPDDTGEPWPYQKTFNAIAAATRLEGGCIFISVKDFVEAFGPTPDATGKCGELVTVGGINLASGELISCQDFDDGNPLHIPCCRKDRVVELLAAERAEKARLKSENDAQEDQISELQMTPWPEWATKVLAVIRKRSGYDGYGDAIEGVDLPAELDECIAAIEADNAAQAARIKELEAENKNHLEEWYRGLRVQKKISDRAEALEAKLAAAEKVREAAIELDEAISDDFNIFGAQQKLRAALGGKP
ncbi:Lar family restriction alleviation protein [Brucella anthropi]|uniref:Lar family restriction alleviation protein n=1 Tax=Brucella anthropi TaxID=529 RepID=UPI000CFBE7F4|nr:Lar family restriction alleviation protein [Ochrobactrum sp. MYb49]PQZ63071.1 hypothetical protein CQ057_16765 [Ochrobactrum sp. MYb49]